MRDTTTEARVPVGLRCPVHPGGPLWHPSMAGPSQQEVRLKTMSTSATLPVTLRAAAGLVSVEALVECVAVSGRDELTPGLRTGLVLCISLKWVFAWLLLRRSAGAALGLLLVEGTTVIAALGAVETPLAARLALGLTAAAVVSLVAASLHAFPPPTLPKA